MRLGLGTAFINYLRSFRRTIRADILQCVSVANTFFGQTNWILLETLLWQYYQSKSPFSSAATSSLFASGSNERSGVPAPQVR